MSQEEPEQLGALYAELDAWDAYDAEDQDVRRARWVAIVTAWVLAHDEMVGKLIGPLSLAELIDLDSTLTSLRHEIRDVIAKTGTPSTRP